MHTPIHKLLYVCSYIPEEQNKNEKSITSAFEYTEGNFFKWDTCLSLKYFDAMYISN